MDIWKNIILLHTVPIRRNLTGNAWHNVFCCRSPHVPVPILHPFQISSVPIPCIFHTRSISILYPAVLFAKWYHTKRLVGSLCDLFIYLFYLYLSFFSSWAGGIKQILQSDWFLEWAEFSHKDRYSRYSGRNPLSWSIFVNELEV